MIIGKHPLSNYINWTHSIVPQLHGIMLVIAQRVYLLLKSTVFDLLEHSSDGSLSLRPQEFKGLIMLPLKPIQALIIYFRGLELCYL